MRKWLKVNKNRIAMVLMSLTICITSLAPSFQVNAQSNVFVDSNGDGKISLSEVNIKNLVAYSLASRGYWVQENYLANLYESSVFQNWVNGASDKILGYLSDKGLVTLSEDMYEAVHTFANVIRGDDGYTMFPALNRSKVYWYELAGANMGTSEYNSYIGSDANFAIGMPISTGYYFTYCSQYYYDRVVNNTAVYIKDGSSVGVYYLNGTMFTQWNVSNSSYVARYLLNSSSYKWSSSNWSSTKHHIAPISNFLGLAGKECVVFNSASDAMKYYTFDRNSYFDSSSNSLDAISLDALNSKDWVVFNSQTYESLKKQIDDARLEEGFNDLTLQQLVNEYSQNILEELKNIEIEQGDQTGLLQKIHDLLNKWLPILGNKEEVDEGFNSSVNDFENSSSEQSSQLGDLVEDSKVEKEEVEDVSGSVDEHIDMESVGDYGVLLSSLTSNNIVIRLILISLSISLIAYIFFGKRG